MTKMTLSKSLIAVDLTYQCPACQFPLVKRGSWFRVVSKYRCEGCGRMIRIGYPEKLKLFEKHTHLLGAFTGLACPNEHKPAS